MQIAINVYAGLASFQSPVVSCQQAGQHIRGVRRRGVEEIDLAVPEDIRLYDADSFILGPSKGDEVEREADIDHIFAKDFERVLDEARRYHGKDFLDPRGFHTRRPPMSIRNSIL